MRKGFVFGKFLPFHNGHVAMIEFAAVQCDLLTVLICCSNLEKVSAERRRKWLVNTFADQPAIDIQVVEYDEALLPNTSVASAEVSKLWAAAFKALFPDYTYLITSEHYGPLVANYMGITHIPFDPDRQFVPISATKIRENKADNWSYLPVAVKADYITKVVILGTESTGKSTLTQQLATHFACMAVTEAGRDLIPDSTAFGLNDLYKVAQKHADDIAEASKGDSGLLIIDTDIHITLSYALYTFGMEPEFEAELYRQNKADLYLYLNNDVEYVQDGTRLEKGDRDRLDASHRKVLHDHGIIYQEIKGNWPERFERALALVQAIWLPRPGGDLVGQASP